MVGLIRSSRPDKMTYVRPDTSEHQHSKAMRTSQGAQHFTLDRKSEHVRNWDWLLSVAALVESEIKTI